MFCGRPKEVEDIIEEAGLKRVAVPTLLVWVLLLLESGQAPAACARVEQYMAAMLAAPELGKGNGSGRTGEDGGPCSSGAAGDALAGSALRRAYGTGLPPCTTAAAAAGAEDRAALARLYTQDVLTQGLGLHAVALAWLTPPPSPSLPSANGGAALQTSSAAAPPPASEAPAVPSALEVLGSEEAVQKLREELERLLEAKGIRLAPVGQTAGGGEGTSGAGRDAGNSTSRAAAMEAGPRGAAAGSAQAKAVAAATSGSSACAPAGACRSTAAASSGRGAPHAPAGPGGAGLRAAASDASGLAHRLQRLLAALRAWLDAAAAAARSLAEATGKRLSAAQAWAVCRAAAAAARLRSLAARYLHAHLHVPSSRALPAALLGGLLVLVAALAEAPHLRGLVAHGWGRLAGAVREALWMGLALNPNPVASGLPVGR